MLMTISLVLVVVTVPSTEDEVSNDVVELGKIAPTLVEEGKDETDVVGMAEISLVVVPVEILLGLLAEVFHPGPCVNVKQTPYSQIVDGLGTPVEAPPVGAVERIGEDCVMGDPLVELELPPLIEEDEGVTNELVE
jgi:hypothetical protein